MHHPSLRFLTSLVLGLMLIGPALCAEPDEDLIRKQQQQRQIREETERMVRQMQSTIRVLQFYQLDKNEEQKLLEEAAQVLGKLSREQMTEVITRLEKAAKAPNQEKADSEKAAAYEKHREIVAELRGLLGRHSVVSTLEEVAQQLEEAAKKQKDMYLTAGPVLQTILDPKLVKRKGNDARGRFQDRIAYSSAKDVLKLLSDHEKDLAKEVDDLLITKLPALKTKLTQDQVDRMSQALDLSEKLEVKKNFETVVTNLLGKNWFASTRNPKYIEALELQWKLTNDLQKIAHALRPGRDSLNVLRSARIQLEEVIATQDSVRGQTEMQKPGSANSQLMLQQGRVAQQAQEIQTMLESVKSPASKVMTESVKDLQAAEKELQKMKPEEAVKLQKKADETLKKAREDLDKAIAAEELKRNDPVAALKDTIESIDKLMAKQGEAQKQTGELQKAEEAPKPEELQKLASQQRQLARETGEMHQRPLPGQDKAGANLQKAEKAMRDASKALTDQKSADAKKLQGQAMDELKNAKKAFEEKVAEIEKRREDIAMLEKSQKELSSLSEQEQQVRDLAKAMSETKDDQELQRLQKELERLQAQQNQKYQKNLAPLAEELAKKQRELTPLAQELADKQGNNDLLTNEMQKRQGELAPLADQLAKELRKPGKPTPQAEKMLQDLAKKQDQLTPLAKRIADDLAEKKGELTPQAQEMAKRQGEIDALTKKLAKELERQKDLPLPPGELARQLAEDFAKKQRDLTPLAQELAKKQGELDPLAKELEKRQGELAPLAEQLAKEMAKQGQPNPQMEKMLQELAKKQNDLTPLAEKLAKDLANKKGELTPQAQEMAKRQQELDALAKQLAEQMQKQQMMQMPPEELAKKLAEQLAKQQRELSPLADDLAKELAKKKGELSPAAKDLAKELAEELAKRQGQLNPQTEEMAKQLAKQLEQMAKRQQQPQLQGEELAKKLAEDLAKRQGELNPQIEELMKQLGKDLSPDAAKKLAESLKNMQNAERDLQNQKGDQASRQANQANQKMQDAMKDLAKALDEKRLKELVEQARLNPQDVSPSKAAQQVAKALEQVENAQGLSKEAAERLAEQFRQMRENGRLNPNADQRAQLAELQRELAKRAREMKLNDAGTRAEDAARALQRGDVRQAMRGQFDAMEELQQALKSADPQKLNAQQIQRLKELAQNQQQLFQSTQSLSRSREATEAALAALAQAQAQAPPGVRRDLEQALRELAQASENLNGLSPEQAREAQRQAGQRLADALRDLNMTADALGQQRARPGENPTAQARRPRDPNQNPQRQPNPQTGPELDRMTADQFRRPDGRSSNSASELLKVQGKGGFIHLPPRQRDLVRQALGQNLPPEYAAMIKQYYLNIAKGKSSQPKR